jgi:hypothetical protein
MLLLVIIIAARLLSTWELYFRCDFINPAIRFDISKDVV